MISINLVIVPSFFEVNSGFSASNSTYASKIRESSNAPKLLISKSNN